MPIEEVGMAEIGSFFLVGCNLLSCFVFWVLEFWDFGSFFLVGCDPGRVLGYGVLSFFLFFIFFSPVVTDA